MAMSTKSKLLKVIMDLRKAAINNSSCRVTAKMEQKVNSLLIQLINTVSEEELNSMYKGSRIQDELPQGRNARWSRAASKASESISELIGLRDEFQDWYDNMPENLQQSALGEKLETITQIDLDSAESAIEEADGADLPQGYGRD